MSAQPVEILSVVSVPEICEDLATVHHIGELIVTGEVSPVQTEAPLTNSQALYKYNQWLQAHGYGICGIEGYYWNEVGLYVPRPAEA